MIRLTPSTGLTNTQIPAQTQITPETITTHKVFLSSTDNQIKTTMPSKNADILSPSSVLDLALVLTILC